MKRLVSSLMFASSIALSASAHAQEAESSAPAGGVEEIIVTAQKRAESLQSVPLSVSAYTEAALEMRGVTNVGQLLLSPPPGVYLQPFSGSPTCFR